MSARSDGAGGGQRVGLRNRRNADSTESRPKQEQGHHGAGGPACPPTPRPPPPLHMRLPRPALAPASHAPPPSSAPSSLRLRPRLPSALLRRRTSASAYVFASHPRLHLPRHTSFAICICLSSPRLDRDPIPRSAPIGAFLTQGTAPRGPEKQRPLLSLHGVRGYAQPRGAGGPTTPEASPRHKALARIPRLGVSGAPDGRQRARRTTGAPVDPSQNIARKQCPGANASAWAWSRPGSRPGAPAHAIRAPMSSHWPPRRSHTN